MEQPDGATYKYPEPPEPGFLPSSTNQQNKTSRSSEAFLRHFKLTFINLNLFTLSAKSSFLLKTTTSRRWGHTVTVTAAAAASAIPPRWSETCWTSTSGTLKPRGRAKRWRDAVDLWNLRAGGRRELQRRNLSLSLIRSLSLSLLGIETQFHRFYSLKLEILMEIKAQINSKLVPLKK